MKLLKKILPVVLGIFLVVIPLIEIQEVKADDGINAGDIMSYINRSAQNYYTYGERIKSYIFEDSDGYCIVHVLKKHKKIEILNCDKSFNIVSHKYIDYEMNLFGGFYNGKDNFYLVWGKNNYDESDLNEVVRITKYSKSWEKISSVSIYGDNTQIPFKAGSLRMTEDERFLYIHTCKTMYVTSDGLNHQSNNGYAINKSDMSVYDRYDYNYVSHSFNQFIIMDDEDNLVTLDQGDAYPRAAVLSRCLAEPGESDNNFENWESINTMNYIGTYGNNETNASLGGLEYSGSSYLTAGSSTDQKEEYVDRFYCPRNIYVSVTDRSNFSEEGTVIKWITSYKSGTIASTPQLVKTGEDSFLLLWEPYCGRDKRKISYVFLDGKGNMTSQIYTEKGTLSDCKPIVSGNKVLWYVTENYYNENLPEYRHLAFYTVSPDGSLSVKKIYSLPEYGKNTEDEDKQYEKYVAGDDDDDYDDEDDYDDDDYDDEDDSSAKIKKGSVIKDENTGAVYKVTGTGKNAAVAYSFKINGKSIKAEIPDNINIDGVIYKVTSIDDKAFYGNSKLEKLTIGKNIEKIGNKAFYNCKKLSYINVKSKKLTIKNIGKNAFGKGYSKPKIKVDKKVYKLYKKIFVSRGISKNSVFV